MDMGADESFDEENGMGWREVGIASSDTVLNDTIHKWRWWPKNGVTPDIDKKDHAATPPYFLPRRDFQCGINLPDFWWDNFSSDVKPTLDRMKQAGANWVQYNPVPQILQFYPKPIILREGANGTPETELLKIIDEAHESGLKVFLSPFDWALGISDPSPDYHDDAWWNAFEEQWRPIMLYYGRIAQEHHVEMLRFSMWPVVYSISAKEAPIVNSLSLALLHDLRKIYGGLVMVEFCPWGPDLTVYKEGDYLGFIIWDFWPYPMSASKSPTVPEMNRNLRIGLNTLEAQSSIKWNKPLILLTSA